MTSSILEMLLMSVLTRTTAGPSETIDHRAHRFSMCIDFDIVVVSHEFTVL